MAPTKDNWVCTDSSCNQYRLDISEKVFCFKEDRIIAPETKETETYDSIIDLDDYTYEEMYSAVGSFGYRQSELDEWIDKAENLDLIAECIFELEA